MASVPVSAPTSTVSTSSKLPGKLNAAHASATARMNASPNSTVGKIGAYEQALVGKAPSVEDAAKALASLTNRDLTVKDIETLNSVLGIKDVKAEDVLGALDKVRNPTEEPSDTIATPAGDETVSPPTEVSATPATGETSTTSTDAQTTGSGTAPPGGTTTAAVSTSAATTVTP
jgi:hypothetical protein